MLIQTSIALLLTCTPAQTNDGGKYVVMVDAGPNKDFLPAAKALADFHKGRVQPFDTGKLDAAFAKLKKQQPRFVVFVLPPDKIDVDLTHDVLARSTRLDDDPFCDFEYGFVTGRDGKAALRFVERIKKAWQRQYGRKAAMFGSWEGFLPPPAKSLTAFKAMKAEAQSAFVLTRAKKEAKQEAAKKALQMCHGKDALLFFSHGYPDEMAACFRAKDLKQWKINFAPAVLVNCACYNGAPGRWFSPGKGGIQDRGFVKRDESVALAILDSGVPAFFGGIDPWHGPLASQVFGHVFDDGLRLGEAANMMHNRLALAFLPEKIHFPPTIKNPKRFAGEGVTNRRHNGGGMIFYGDPSFAPFAKNASHLRFAEIKRLNKKRVQIHMGCRPLVDGQPMVDYMVPLNWLFDYYSVKSNNYLKELSLEIYRVVELPQGVDDVSGLRVKSARSGQQKVPTKTPQVVVERTPAGNRLHVRVPLDALAIGTAWTQTICREGISIELEGAFVRR